MAPRRIPYTAKEEKQMWQFVASELRLGNEEAHKKSTTKLWADYKRRYPESEKNPSGLDTHYRRQMIARVSEADVPKRDLFVLMRLHRARVSECHKDRLQAKFRVEIETNTFGEFILARSIDDDPPKCFPTATERRKIFGETLDDADDDEGDNDDHGGTDEQQQPRANEFIMPRSTNDEQQRPRADEGDGGDGGWMPGDNFGSNIIDDDEDAEMMTVDRICAPDTPSSVPLFRPAAITARAPMPTRRDERELAEEELMFAESERRCHVERRRQPGTSASGREQQQPAAKRRRVDEDNNDCEQGANDDNGGAASPRALQVRDIDEEERGEQGHQSQPSPSQERSEERQVLVKRRVSEATAVVGESAVTKFSDVFHLCKNNSPTGSAMPARDADLTEQARRMRTGTGGGGRRVPLYHEDQDSPIASPTSGGGEDADSSTTSGDKMCSVI